MEQKEFVQAGALILKQGTVGNQAYVVESGKIEVSMKDPDGVEILLAELGPGEIFGEMAALFGGKRIASARASGDSVVTVLSGQKLQESTQESDSMRTYLMDLIANRTIRNICLFTDISEEEKKKLPRGEGPFLCADKEYLFKEDDPIKYLYVLCSGHVQEYRNIACGHEITVDLHKAGDMFCKSAPFLKDGLFHTNARAIDNAYVVRLPIEQFKEVMKKHESVADRLLSTLARMAMMKQIEVEQQATMTAPQILAFYLRQLCVSYGLDPRGFTLPYKKSLIASRLGMEMETLSRAWPKLKELGIVVKGSHISFVEEDTGSPA
jgi:CRP-like cAMP-binding protein